MGSSTILKDLLLHPLTQIAILQLLYGGTAVFTKRGSPLRYLGVFTLIAVSLCGPKLAWRYLHSTDTLGNMIAFSMANIFFFGIDRLLFRGWDMNNISPVAKGSTDTKFKGSRLDFVAQISGLRGIGSWWQIRGVPAFSSKDASYVPSRTRFFFNNLAITAVCLLTHNLIIEYFESLGPATFAKMPVSIFARIDQVDMDELSFRALLTVLYWIRTMCFLMTCYHALCVVAAVFTPSAIRDWPPLFQSFRHAYTIRGFWGKSWHQCLRFTLEGWSEFLTHKLLRLPRSGRVQRYLKIFISFAISGLMHCANDIAHGQRLMDTGTLRAFCMQAVGIMLEDAVQAMWKSAGMNESKTARKLAKPLGFVWVLSFMTWTSACWMYPLFANMNIADSYLGVGLFKPLLNVRPVA